MLAVGTDVDHRHVAELRVDVADAGDGGAVVCRAAHEEHVSRTNSRLTDEDAALEQALQQSLAEEEARRARGGPAQKGKGKDAATGDEDPDGQEDEDDELRRAVALSLQSAGHKGHAPGEGLAEGEEEGETSGDVVKAGVAPAA